MQRVELNKIKMLRENTPGHTLGRERQSPFHLCMIRLPSSFSRSPSHPSSSLASSFLSLSRPPSLFFLPLFPSLPQSKQQSRVHLRVKTHHGLQWYQSSQHQLNTDEHWGESVVSSLCHHRVDHNFITLERNTHTHTGEEKRHEADIQYLVLCQNGGCPYLYRSPSLSFSLSLFL